jgi:hypothetical protein
MHKETAENAENIELYRTLKDLHAQYLKKREGLRIILKETAVLKRQALLTLERALRLTRHLTGRQRQLTGFVYTLGEIKARIKEIGIENNSRFPLEIQDDLRSLPEIKQKGLLILSMIDDIGKKLLQLNVLELRCRELILAVNKALEAFRHESGIIRRKLYPFGVFSMGYRSLRELLGNGYFSFRDMEELSALGNITGSVLKIADSCLI